MIETTDVSNDVGFELGTLSVNLDALAKEELVQDLRVPPPTSKDLRAAAEIDTNTDQDADERDSVVICGHSFSVNQPSRRSTIDIEPAIELEGDMAVEVTVEEQEGEGEGVDELTHDAPEVGGEAEATKGDRESVTIRGHSFNVNRPARRRSTTGVLGDSTDGAAPEDRVVVRERRSSVGDIL